MSRELMLGTAGHIDHSKTSLVKALTGVDTAARRFRWNTWLGWSYNHWRSVTFSAERGAA
jgi:translation elongation factor EF-Tu-like GTPase